LIYRLNFEIDAYPSLAPAKPSDRERLRTVSRGERQPGDAWDPPWVVTVAAMTQSTERPDFTSCIGLPAASTRALDALGPVIGDAAEALPLVGEGSDYWVLDVHAIADIMDVDRSEAHFLAPDRIDMIYRLAVREGAEVPPIFKLPQWRAGEVLVTDDFLGRVAEASLTGVVPRAIGEDHRDGQ
jgi:hypothetical protein